MRTTRTITAQASTWEYAAKNPGTWANNLKVCTIDGAADQIVTGINTAGVTVGMGVTQTIDGRVTAGAGSTSTYSGFLRGIITEVGGGDGTTGTMSVKIVDRVATDGTVTAAEYRARWFTAIRCTIRRQP